MSDCSVNVRSRQRIEEEKTQSGLLSQAPERKKTKAVNVYLLRKKGTAGEIILHR